MRVAPARNPAPRVRRVARTIRVAPLARVTLGTTSRMSRISSWAIANPSEEGLPDSTYAHLAFDIARRPAFAFLSLHSVCPVGADQGSRDRQDLPTPGRSVELLTNGPGFVTIPPNERAVGRISMADIIRSTPSAC